MSFERYKLALIASQGLDQVYLAKYQSFKQLNLVNLAKKIPQVPNWGIIDVTESICCIALSLL